MADFNKPATTDTYANVLAYINAKFSDLALGLDPATSSPTNLPTNAVRWNSANNRFEKYNGTVWAALSSTFAFTDLSASGAVTLGGGTANGVPYLNASKQLVSGSALTFDGANLTLAGSVSNLYIQPSSTTSNALIRAINAGGIAYIGLDNSSGGLGGAYSLNLWHSGAYPIVFATNNAEQMRLNATGLGLGYSTLYDKLQVNGSISSQGGGYFAFYRNGASNNLITLAGVSVPQFGIAGGVATGNVDASLWVSGYKDLRFVTNGTEAGRFDSTGFLVGATSAGYSAAGRGLIEINGSSSALLALRTGGTNRGYLYTQGTDMIAWAETGAFSIGTATAAQVSFITNNAERGRFDGAGNFLLGTTNTLGSSKMTVLGSGGTKIRVSDTVNTAWRGYTMGVNDNTDYAYMLFNANSGELQIQSGPNSSYGGYLTFLTAGSERARIDSAGNFGIGTSSPLVRFQAGGATGTTAWSWFTGNSTNPPAGCTYGTLFGTNLSQGNSEANLVWGQGVGSQQYFAIGKWTGSAYTEQLRIASDGVITATAGNVMSIQASSVATTSGTTADFTGIPSWVKKIKLIISEVKVSGTGNILVQIGNASLGIQTSGYTSQYNAFNNSPGGVAVTNGVQITGNSASTYSWNSIVEMINVSGNSWVVNGTAMTTIAAVTAIFSGSRTMTAALDRVRVTVTSGGFTAGSVNIIYE